MTQPSARILVVDDERSMREFLAIMLTREGYEIVAAENGAQALAALRQRSFDLLISDIRMPDCSGIDVLREAKTLQPDLPGILMTAFSSTQTAIEALRTGALDYISKPFDVDEMKRVVAQALERRTLRDQPVAPAGGEPAEDDGRPRARDTMIGRSPAMQRVFSLIEAIAGTSSTVLITGESGTGKEMAARAIHRLSPRAERPFVALNCGALTETLLESELFGHEKGAFTGAMATTRGLIEQAEKGTIFLDELGEMSAMMQVKLLRVLQERRFRRVGGHEEIAADIRIIAATNRDLAKMVSEGTFREDLYYRVNVIPVALPPLRERRDDIPVLARHFVQRFAREMRRPGADLSPEAMDALLRHPWPGNIRELENVLERAVALETSPAITLASLPDHLLGVAPLAVAAAVASGDGSAASAPAPLFPDEGFDLERHVQDVEREYLAEALRRADGVKVRAAELLGMSFRSFRYYAKKYNL
ncbi:acetoacetate metabolism regulatory protein AtoC [Luteitalea sp. TBR-22]|uniref:sigma-54-dependent transcriptional regulator n=1 Tax=Luteitalea sp. TBR-22 TaxID=2802971 RepID=UPI001AF9E10B|nr:sigma-54 dependent transcriptional regulator [Luteitalea sp. TBR-22]BCS34565.1 acetoacetate metabolism regulatory protein AtoC [Luteitalea sp. TBR-22]